MQRVTFQQRSALVGISRPTKASRAGISLLEVVLALGIFLGAIAALSQLSSTGMRTAVSARLQTQAILRCESKLAELVAAIEPLDDVTDQPFEDDENWTWTLVSVAGPHADLLNLTVSVRYEGGNQQASTGYSLSRLVRDPIVFEEAAAAEAEAAAAEEDAL
jgi:Tfp pilus assembly protein PilV